MSLAASISNATSSLSPRGERAGVRGETSQVDRRTHAIGRGTFPPSPQPSPLRGEGAKAFTLIEVLAAMLLIGIVIPAVMRAVATASSTANVVRMRTEAAGLAQSKLGELVATGEWQNGKLSGTFGADWPDYRWEAENKAWSGDRTGANLTQIDVTVIFNLRGRDEAVTLSTMAYPRNAP